MFRSDGTLCNPSKISKGSHFYRRPGTRPLLLLHLRLDFTLV